MEDPMKRERTLQVVLVLVGLFYSFWDYFLFEALWHSRWLNGNGEVGPMFVSLNTVLGVFLLLAVKQPAKHRSLIAYGAWSSLAHGAGGFDRSMQQHLMNVSFKDGVYEP